MYSFVIYVMMKKFNMFLQKTLIFSNEMKKTSLDFKLNSKILPCFNKTLQIATI